MSYNDLNSKVEDALKSVVDDLGLVGVTVNTGASTIDLDAPYVVCACSGGGEEPENLRGTGIYSHTATVAVASSLDDDSIATHRARVASVFDAFRDDDIAATLSAAVLDFFVYDVIFRASTMEEAERKVTNTLEMEIVCCGSDLT